MGDKKTSLPSTPNFQTDPNVGWSQDRMKEQYGYLIDGLTKQGGNLTGLLGDSINVSPEVSRLSQQYAQSQLDPAFRQKRQQTINDLEANNQLTGSTTASALGNLDADYMASLTGMQAQYGLADVSRALNNRMQLYTTGLNIGQNVGQVGLQNQEQMNSFALANYENQVASALMSEKQGGDWLGGGLLGAGTGAISGAVLGSVVPGVGTLAGGLVGGYLGGGAGALAGGLGGMGAAGQVSSGIGQLGGYMAGSKYAPTAYTYTRGPESVTDLTSQYKMSASPLYSQGLGGY